MSPIKNYFLAYVRAEVHYQRPGGVAHTIVLQDVHFREDG